MEGVKARRGQDFFYKLHEQGTLIALWDDFCAAYDADANNERGRLLEFDDKLNAIIHNGAPAGDCYPLGTELIHQYITVAKKNPPFVTQSRMAGPWIPIGGPTLDMLPSLRDLETYKAGMRRQLEAGRSNQVGGQDLPPGNPAQAHRLALFKGIVDSGDEEAIELYLKAEAMSDYRADQLAGRLCRVYIIPEPPHGMFQYIEIYLNELSKHALNMVLCTKTGDNDEIHICQRARKGRLGVVPEMDALRNAQTALLYIEIEQIPQSTSE